MPLDERGFDDDEFVDCMGGIRWDEGLVDLAGGVGIARRAAPAPPKD